MSNYSSYQIALIAILVINLVFWSLVVCFRLFFDCTCSSFGGTEGRNETQLRRQRRRLNRRLSISRNRSNNQMTGLRNPAFSNSDEVTDPRLYNIGETMDPPPSYEDALQYGNYLNSARNTTRDVRHLINARELPVILSVPGQPTSSAEIRCQNTLNINHSQISSYISQARKNRNNLTDIALANDNNAESSAIMIEDDNVPLTFVVDNVGKQSARILGTETVFTTLTDGEQLTTDSNA